MNQHTRFYLIITILLLLLVLLGFGPRFYLRAFFEPLEWIWRVLTYGKIPAFKL